MAQANDCTISNSSTELVYDKDDSIGTSNFIVCVYNV